MEWELSDWLGLVGAAMLLYAFWRNASGTWQSTSLLYQLTNLAAALILIIYAIQKQAFANVALNIVWFIITAVSIRTYISGKSKDVKHSKNRTKL